ncbi:hypothetical protein Pla175_07070 [Pirellulimonas nuda]|uniref:SLA1 homology domain-containing protein n=1 Tax=Pirellulimonas nuda TaxID=2528009 RepID=A0A518D778_9BACT|nr:DUF6263 family protein [Pirellulimonas nuda]QDU87348.1 hypothetical protein Pla175_07070 [Pirellulimonas nuda]
MHRSLYLTLLVVLACSTALADDAKQYTLRYKLAMGDVLRWDVDHRASIRSTMEGKTQEAQTRSDSVKAWKVVDVLPGGDIEFLNLVEEIQMTNRLPERAEMAYDSTSGETPPPGFEDAAKAVGVPLSQVRMTPWGKVVNRTEKHHQPAADNTAPITVLLPEKPVAIGDTWDEPLDIAVKTAEGGTKQIETRRHYQLKSVTGQIATIEAAHQVLTPIDAHIEAQLAQRLLVGVIRLDMQKGRIVEQDFDVDKRVLGFAGPTSSMHYVMKLREKLLDGREDVARKP